MAKVSITSPVGRYVQGSLYEAKTTDSEGKPLLFKRGADVGKPRVEYFFAIAIPKNPGESHWSQAKEVLSNGVVNDWGSKILAVGNAAYPGQSQSPLFSWKIEDGDSTIPNKNNKRPCDREGFPGNWILRFSGGFKPKIYRLDSGTWVNELTEDFVKPGDFIQVSFEVEANAPDSKTPGVYLNHRMVAFTQYGPRIEYGPDVESAGFGLSKIPPGASAVPLASSAPLPHVASVIPNMAFGSVPTAPPPVSVAPAPIAKQMTPAANGVTYEAYIAAGWNDAQMIAAGLLMS